MKLNPSFLAILALFVLLLAGDAMAAKPGCGDNKCSGGETPASCPQDCSVSVDVCGDTVCGITETAQSCPADCSDPGFCGDGQCGDTESWESCPADCDPPPPANCNNDGVCNDGEDCLGCGDCNGRTGGNPKNRFCCGGTTCEFNQCGASCGSAVPVCGNGIVEYGEECDGGTDCDLFCHPIVVQSNVPLNQFNIGDSIGEGEAANGTIGAANHQAVWSTGYDGGDVVNSLNERFETLDDQGYVENNSTRDPAINHAVSGAVMADFASQAQSLRAAMGSVPPGSADMVTILLGNNDVCASSLDAMTLPGDFKDQYRAGLDILAAAPFADTVNLQVSGIPAIYWLWHAKRSDFWCRVFTWPFVPCENLLDGAADDCVSSASAEDPDRVHTGDGPNCQRRKEFHRRIRDVYNPILRDVLIEYQGDGLLPNAEYIDILDVRFESQHVNGGDCFHPSKAGHALMSTQQWCRSKWAEGDASCTP